MNINCIGISIPQDHLKFCWGSMNRTYGNGNDIMQILCLINHPSVITTCHNVHQAHTINSAVSIKLFVCIYTVLYDIDVFLARTEKRTPLLYKY